MSGLQEHEPGSGCSLCPPHLSSHSSGGLATDGHQQHHISPQCCTGGQTQVGGQTHSSMVVSHIQTLLVICVLCGLTITLFVNCRYNRLDYLYLNAGIMPNPQFDAKAFFKGLCSRYTVYFRCSHGAASLLYTGCACWKNEAPLNH